MTFLSQSTAKIYVSFHTHGLCFWLNCARSPVLDSLLAASLTFATTSWEVALSCATTRLVSEKANRTTPRTTRTLLVFMILPFQVSLGSRCYAQLPCSVNADLPWHFLGGGTALLIKSLGKIKISRCQAAASVSEGNTVSTGHQARHDPRKGAEPAATAGLVRGN